MLLSWAILVRYLLGFLAILALTTPGVLFDLGLPIWVCSL
uniref:Uncharacterized protein n=1 Tax=Lepeophtheirus salmonis TaxID=72036 RepID=A0A0K2VAM1_LEPSM